ncbi:hypothetical protein APHAL10511_001405 [Amanita phalloides]|nr:hypothetical protein APHAL10511_001405 [Amanita phalloides]
MVASQTFTVGNLRHNGFITAKGSATGHDVKLVPRSGAGVLKVDPPPSPKHTVTTSFRNEKGLYVGVKGPAHPDSIPVWVTEKYEWEVKPVEEGQYIVYPPKAALLWYDGNTPAHTIQLKGPDQLITLVGLAWDIKPVHG